MSSDNVAPEQVEELGQQKRGTLQDTIKRIMAVDAVALVVALILLLVVFSFTSPHFFKTRNERWLNLYQRMTQFAKTRAEYRCEYCGRPEDTSVGCHGLTVYYLDGDDRNWEPENLCAVCWRCYWYLQERCHQLALPGMEHPLDRLRRVRG